MSDPARPRCAFYASNDVWRPCGCVRFLTPTHGSLATHALLSWPPMWMPVGDVMTFRAHVGAAGDYERGHEWPHVMRAVSNAMRAFETVMRAQSYPCACKAKPLFYHALHKVCDANVAAGIAGRVMERCRPQQRCIGKCAMRMFARCVQVELCAIDAAVVWSTIPPSVDDDESNGNEREETKSVEPESL